MRIQIQLPPNLLSSSTNATASSSKLPSPSTPTPPIVQLGADLVMIEVQGDLAFEGNPGGKVIGLLGLERADKPTLHLGQHQLLYGKIVNLPKPFVVMRRAAARDKEKSIASAEEAEEIEEDDLPILNTAEGSGDEQTNPPSPTTLPAHLNLPSSPPPASSSPFQPPAAARDYSSDLSSPVRPFVKRKRAADFTGNGKGTKDGAREMMGSLPVEEGEIDIDIDVDAESEGGKAEARATKRQKITKNTKGDEMLEDELRGRTREYKVVGLIRKKVVFSLRPEPIVTATILPE